MQDHLFWSQSTGNMKIATTNLKWCLQVIMVSNSKVLDGPPFLDRLNSGASLFEVPDVLGIGPLPTATVLTGVSPREDDRRLQLQWHSITGGTTESRTFGLTFMISRMKDCVPFGNTG